MARHPHSRLYLGVIAAAVALSAPILRADNVIQIENAKAGTTAWQLTTPTVNREIEGYASLTSVNRGGQISFYVNTSESSYTLEIFRTGWYGGAGGRRLLGPVTRQGVSQPIPQPDPTTFLIECNWTDPYVLTIPSTPSDPSDPAYWASGVYMVKLTALTSGRQRWIVFVVRDDARPSDYVFQSGVNTHQAYNTWGGRNLYTVPQARMVSFNRPEALYDGGGLFKWWELSILRFLEREGYDVTYCTDVDIHESANLLLSHRAYLSVAHDEYWSWQMRRNVEAARDLGVGLGFLDGNSCYWQIRLAPSAITGAPDRTIVAYKAFADAEDPVVLDGDPTNNYLETTQWRLNPVNRPEDGLIGVMYLQGNYDSDFMVEDASHWVYSGTGVVTGEKLFGLIGSETDRMYGHSPPTTARFGHSPVVRPAGVSFFGPVDFSDAVSYVAPSGATVVGVGSMQWGWALDDQGVPTDHTSRLNPAAQQMTHNILARLIERGANAGSAVSLSSTASPQPAVPGGTVMLGLSVTNQGPSPLTNVVVTDALPTGLTFQSATSTVGSCGSVSGTVNCSLGQLGGGATATITITVVVGASQVGTVETAISVTADQPQAANTLPKLVRVVSAGFSPTFGTEGAIVSIYGLNLGTATAVQFNGISAPFSINSSNQITTHVPAGATNGSLSLTTSGGTTSLGTFVVTGNVTGFSPRNGPSGTAVTINGTSFTGVTAVRFNGNNASSFTVNSPTQITAVVQPGATTGKISIVKPNGPGGRSIAIYSAGYFSITSASITGFSPTSGPAGTTVTVTGSGFTGVNAVYLNDRSASFTASSNTQFTFVVPSNATSGLITLNATAGTPYSSSAFTVTTPSISLFSPSAGPPGTPVFIDGGNLANVTSVTFNGLTAAFSLLPSNRIVATVPAGAASGTISIVTPAGSATSAVYGYLPGPFTVIGAPTIGSIVPTSGGAGANVVIGGTNLTGATSVRFNGVSATTFTVNSSTQITAVVPSGATIGPIGVTTLLGAITSAGSFTVIPPPTISGFAPASGAVGSSVAVTGTNLTGATSVAFNGTSTATFSVDSSTQITAVVPAGATAGPISVTTPGGTAASASSFGVAPAISNFSPATGPAGTSVVITGTSLTGATLVAFNGTAAVSFSVDSATQITATVPAGATTGIISVTTPGGTATGASSFAVISPPTITGFSPGGAPAGTSVVITGTNFTGATAVAFNGTAAASFSVDSSTQITAIVPAGATSGPISVTTPGGTATSSSALLVSPTPTISGFSPTNGPSGTSVVITGTNLTGASAVGFNGTAAASFSVNSSTQVTATVPSGATSGPISVTTPGGTATSASGFTVGTQPSITSFYPPGGPAGASVVLTGANFAGATAVTFNGTNAASFHVDSSAQITATVPVGATMGPIAVTTPSGTATSATSFVVGPAPVISGFQLTSGVVGDVISVVGSDFTGATGVTFNGIVAAFFMVNTDAQLTATVPFGASTGRIVVTGPDGSGIGPTDFIVTAFSPVIGPVGTTVTITGTSFTGATAVTFGGVGASFGVDSDTQVTATVPAGAVTGPIVVTAPGGTFTSPSAFTVTSFSPIAGPFGAVVTVLGSSFTGATSVTFGGVSASFSVNSDSQVTATVPSGASTGPIVVSAPGGPFTDPTNFTVTPFSPTSGPTGTAVTITGSGFTGATSVTFDGFGASFTVDSDNQVTGTVPPGATTGPVAVVAPATTFTSVSHFDVTSPAITSFSPSSGVVGASVVITGANFQGATSVQFNGVGATFTVDASIQITATVPAGATTGPISVTTPEGTAMSAGSFTVVGGPTITNFAPASGAVGTSVVITGTNLTGATSVTFNGTSATTFTVNSATQITATVPAAATTGPIAVTTPGGTVTSSSNFTVALAPTITSFAPTSGAVGASVVITGTNFTSATAVTFNGTSPTTFTVDSATQVTVTVPAAATTGPISVTTPGGTATSASSFTIVPAPTITSFAPASGLVGTLVVITGTNLTGTTSVRFNGTSATTFTVNSSTQVTATVPSGATTGPVSVTTPGGTATSATSFTVSGAPTITSFSPTSGSVGATVVITGTSLTGATSVKFNTTSATTFTVNSATQITATVPAAATTGPISVTTPGGTATSASSFMLTTGGPTITSFSPTMGIIGASVIVNGTAFTGATSLTFNGTSATFTINSSTKITTSVPSGATTGPIAVTTPSGTAISATSFGVSPRVTTFAPTVGTVGTTVVITGTNFTETTSVTFNGTNAAFTVNSSTQITATVPSGATTGKIKVTAPAGTWTTSSDFRISPTVTSFSPTHGPVGTTVVITGLTFADVTAVKFHGLAASFTINSSTQITSTVPSGATTGAITVTNSAGTATSASPFTMNASLPPTISGFSPAGGPSGTSVVITGTNLTGASAVGFNGTAAASFSVNSSTQVTATVPSGATSGPISVTTPGGTATSASGFTVGTQPSITSFYPPGGPAGASVVLTGANFAGATAVTFNGTNAASFHVDSSAQITATVPVGATMGPIAVTTPSGTATSATSFVVGPAPVISGFQLTSGVVGDVISVVGSDFTGATGVTFNGIVAAFFMVNTDAQLTATVPFGASTGRIVVTGPDGSGIGPTDFIVTAFSPVIGPVGTTVTITGTSFTGATAVTFGGVGASFGVDSDTQVTATVPAGAVTGPIVVTAPGGTFTSPSAFTVTSFSPIAGPFGAVVTVLGSSFTGATSVTFGGVSASFSVNSDSQVTATVPSGASTGPIVVSAPGGPFTDPTNFTVTPFSPTSGPTGTAVTITGSGFTGATSVTFDGFGASFTVDSDNQVTGTVPPGATTGPVAVVAPATTFTSVSHFDVTSPAITSFSPSSGVVGASVVITGANFQGATSVQFNGVGATFTVDASIQITATVPAGATTGPISVTTPEGTAMSAGSFTVVGGPTITNFAPASGAVGTSVVITGTNLTGATSVTFNGTSATTFTVNSATQITATVPAAATTGPIAVTTPGGTVTSSSNFTVALAPTITSFAPTSGAVGASVVITGTNLTGATSVKFNGTSATTFTVNSATQITATVPAGATTGPISVTTPGGAATSASSFTIAGGPTIASFSPTMGIIGASVIVNGTAFTGATSLTFNGTSATFTINSSTKITTSVPSGATTGPIAVTTPGGTAISGASFAVSPRVTTFAPTSGPVGTNVVITGANFTGTTSVTFNGTNAAFTVNSSTQITATVPSGATTGKIKVTAPAGSWTTSSDFRVSPKVTSFSPTHGPVGTTVVITGLTFADVTAVKFHGLAASFTINSPTQITVTVPSGATTGTLWVTNAAGTGVSTTNFSIP